MRQARAPDRIGKAGDLIVEDIGGGVGRAIRRRDAGAAGSDYHVDVFTDRGDSAFDHAQPSGTTTGAGVV